MAEIAVDVVLLPSEEMVDKTIAANRELLKQCADKIVLDKEGCLPHISLAMGCIDERATADIETVLQTIAKQCSLGQLRVIGIHSGTNSGAEQVSVLQIERTKALQSLHEEVMRRLAPYFNYDVTADMVLSPPKASESTLAWIKSYPEKSSFENFSPHITIGYGEINDYSFPIDFTASKLALCHLGNHCTCREILASAELKSWVWNIELSFDEDLLHYQVDSVHVRINPYAVKVDVDMVEDIPKVEAAVKAMRRGGKAVIGMKIIGEGTFGNSPEKRDKSIKYALESGCLDAMVVGFEKVEEIDDFAVRAHKVSIGEGVSQLLTCRPARVA